MRERKLELAWAAGFYDGEGSVSCTANNGNPHTRVQLSVGQKDEVDGNISCTLLRFRDAVGAGKIYRKSSSILDRHQHQYLVCSKGGVTEVLLRLWPYLSEAKREQARQAFRLLDSGIKNSGLEEREPNENF